MSRTMMFATTGTLVLGMALTSSAQSDDGRENDPFSPRLSCAEFRALSAQVQLDALSWLDGYERGTVKSSRIGKVNLNRDSQDLAGICPSDRGTLRREVGSRTLGGRVSAEPGRMSCQEFAELDLNVQRDLIAFADGFFARSQSSSGTDRIGNYGLEAERMGRECGRDPRASFWSALDTSSSDVSSGDRLNERDRDRDRPDRTDRDRRNRGDDLQRMTCDEFRSLDAGDQGQVIAWMDGYSRTRRANDIGAAELDRRTNQIAKICDKNSDATLSSQLRSNLPDGRKQVMPGRMSCSEFNELDRNLQAELVAFAGGYHARNRSSRESRRNEELSLDPRDVSKIQRACEREPNVSFWEKTDGFSRDSDRSSRF